MTEQKDNRETEYRRHTGTTSTPSRRRNKKRLRKLPFIILIILIILITIIVYITHQYNSGMKYAKEHAKDVKMHKFNGAVKNDGKISVLVLGADKAQSGKSRTDSIMVVQYDYVNKKIMQHTRLVDLSY